MASFKYTVELELTEKGKQVFDEYLDENCFDSHKWLARHLYWGVYSAINRFLEKKAQKPLVKAKQKRRNI